MALHKKGKRPPNPDPGNCTWINTKEGGFWRKNRGLVKEAELNSSCRQSSENIKVCSPAASRIIRKLRPYTDGLQPGRITVRICGKLLKELNTTSKLNMSCLFGLDMQPDHPIHNLLQEDVQIEQNNNTLIVTIPITRYTIKRLNTLVTNYWFELVLLYGDAGKEDGLRTESEDSTVYAIETSYKNDCRLSLVLPEQPWIALLKVNSIEGNEPATHNKLYGMKVIAAAH
ncbi:MAG: hypothetical protein ABJB05_09090 [Parafilimonas sp.]